MTITDTDDYAITPTNLDAAADPPKIGASAGTRGQDYPQEVRYIPPLDVPTVY